MQLEHLLLLQVKHLSSFPISHCGLGSNSSVDMIISELEGLDILIVISELNSIVVEKSGKVVVDIISEVEEYNIGVFDIKSELESSNKGVVDIISELEESVIGVGNIMLCIEESDIDAVVIISEFEESDMSVDDPIFKIEESDLDNVDSISKIEESDIVTSVVEINGIDSVDIISEPLESGIDKVDINSKSDISNLGISETISEE